MFNRSKQIIFVKTQKNNVMSVCEFIYGIIGFIIGAGVSIPITIRVTSRKNSVKVKQKNVKGTNVAGRDIRINR